MLSKQSYVPPENAAINKGNHPEQIAQPPGSVRNEQLQREMEGRTGGMDGGARPAAGA